MNTKSVIWFIFGIIGVMGLVVALLWQFGSNAGKPIADIAGNKLHTKGSGQVEIVEFSDFECPACKSVQPALSSLLTKYVDKVTFVYRHFPLTNIHPYAMIGSQAAEAASLQGKFWEMHDLLFDRQDSWAKSDPKQVFVGYAKELGLDESKFVSDMDSQGVKDAINVDVLAATKYQVSGTPTFYVNGVETPFEQIEAKLQ